MKRDTLNIRAPKRVMRLGTSWIVILAIALMSVCAEAGKGNGKGGGGGGGKGGGKGGGGTSSQWIDVQIWLDDIHSVDPGRANGLVADDANLAYTHDQEKVRAQVGSSGNIDLNLNTKSNKPAIRHFLLPNGFPSVLDLGCAPEGVTLTDERPALRNVIPDAWLQIMGPDFDDLPPGYVRHVNARIAFQDEAGQVWMLHYGARPLCSWEFPDCMQYAPCGSCILVKRLPNTPDGKSQWQFATEPRDGLHLGYLYRLSSDRNTPTMLAGIIDLPWSGLIETLDPQPLPPSEGYVIPDDPPECPAAP